MENQEFTGRFENISQRVASSHLKSLSALTLVLPEGAGPAQQAEVEAGQRDLHAFFRAVYETMLRQPDLFGLPMSADIYLDEYHPEASLDKQEANRRLAKPRGVVDMGLDFLMQAGQAGQLEGQSLVLTPAQFAACLAKPKVVRKFIQGFAQAGLVVTETKERVTLHNPRFPAMLPALQALAAACAQYKPNLGRFHFARCDFQALKAGYEPQVLDLYRIFDPADFAFLAELHTFFTGMGFKTSLNIAGIFCWVVQYQGNRKVKASPMFQVEYQDRVANPLLVQIKCASTNRIAPLLPKQSPALQADYFQRVFRCNGDKCGWCKNRKYLGPSQLEFNGQQKTACWYSNSAVRELTPEAVDLIKQYAWMHEQLLSLN